MLFRYCILIIGCVALLAGVQIPNFLTQYQQRLAAQLTEVETNLAGFQQIADRYFEGSLTALLTHHEQSDDRVFRAEVEPLAQMINRQHTFAAAQGALDTPYPSQLWHLAWHANPELRQATWQNYSVTVPLTQQALLTGIIVMVVFVVFVEIVWALLKAGWRRPKGHDARRL